LKISHPIEGVGFEAGTLSQHLVFGLTAEGFDVVCLEARKVNTALSAMNFVPALGHWGTRTGHAATRHNLARSPYCQIDVNGPNRTLVRQAFAAVQFSQNGRWQPRAAFYGN
jgi:hypothetical protein